MRLAPPAFLLNVVRDLRDRRLLLPAAALLGALIAVPLLLSQSPAPAPPTAQTQGIEPTAASPAVLTEELGGIRDYRKRLAALKQKNPFDQRFSAPEPGSADITETPSPSAGDPPGGVGGASQPTDPAGAAMPSSPGSPDPGPAGGSQGPSEPSKPRVKRLWWTWTVDLAFGKVGEVTRRARVGAMDLLPSRRNPLVAFLGAGPDGTRATFMISDEVTSSDGDGRCAPTRAECYFLRLKPGQQRRLSVAPEDGPTVNYRLRLRSINEKIVKRRK